MRTRTLILTGIGCLVAFIGIGIASAAVYFLAGDRIRQKLEVWRPGGTGTAGSLYGSYEMVSESGGWHPAAKARVILDFVEPGTLALRATRPGESLTDVGTFNVSGRTITLNLPEIGKSASNSPFTVDGQSLVLPFQLFGEGTGTSTWKRLDDSADPLSQATQGSCAIASRDGREAALKAVATALQKNPAVKTAKICGSATVLVTYQDGYQEFFLAPPGESRTTSKQEEPGDAMLGRPRSAVRVRVLRRRRHGAAPLQRVQFLRLGGGPLPGMPGIPGSAAAQWLAYEPDPISKGDAPPERTALILAPFDTLPVLIPGTGGAAFPTFKSMGEKLGVIQDYLKHAHYDTSNTFTNQQVTVKLLYEKLKDQRWGVFFMSTHSGFEDDDAILITGEEVPQQFSATPGSREQFLDQYFQNYLDTSVAGSLGPEVYQRLRASIIVGFIYQDHIPFIAIKSSFFKAAGADFSKSMVVLSACESAATSYVNSGNRQSVQVKGNFRDALGARSFAGWTTDVDTELGADIDQEFFHYLSRKTRSDREAMQFAIDECMDAHGHDWTSRKDHAAPKDRYKMEAKNFVIYRKGKNTPETFLLPAQLMMARAARHWTCQFKGGKGLDESMDNLCKYDPKEPSINPQFYFKEALNCVDVPRAQIDEVKGELCGYGGDPARFTLEE